MECARRLGKSYLLCVLALEVCLKKPRARIVYCAQTQKEVHEIIVPTVEALIADAPADCAPIWKSQEGHYVFPNGALFVVFGAEDKKKANRGRGPGADLVLVDEAGFISILGYVLSSILNPQTLTTAGRTIIASTPSDEPDHDFSKIAEAAEADGAYANRTIYDNPRLTPGRIEEYIADDAALMGMTPEEFKASDIFQREYMAKRVVDKTLVVMGEDWRHIEVVDVPRPQFFDAYETLDMGGVDPHAWLGGYWHFEKSWLVIEDELLLRDGENTEELAEAIRAKEVALWGTKQWEGTMRALHEERTDPILIAHMPDWLRAKIQASEQAPLQPYLRICDNDIQIARDLAQLHGLAFMPTQKTDKRWYVNEFRILARQGRVKIAPRCRNTMRHLKATVWANHRMTDYRRNQAGEHGDLVDCCVYKARNIRKNKSPTPDSYGKSFDTLVKPKPPSPWLKVLAGGMGRR